MIRSLSLQSVFMSVGALASASGAVIACSDVPDITFPPEDAGKDGALGEGGTDAAADVVRDTFVPPPVPCPDAAPAGGVCCGARACEGCSASDCTDCNAKNCGAGEVCCARGSSMHCTGVGKCN